MKKPTAGTPKKAAKDAKAGGMHHFRLYLRVAREKGVGYKSCLPNITLLLCYQSLSDPFKTALSIIFRVLIEVFDVILPK